MSRDVHLHVCFACNSNEPVAELAKRHLETMKPDQDGEYECREAVWFLKDLSERTGENPGSRGGLSLWGIIGNYTRADKFVEVLTQFWKELLMTHKTRPFDFEHIIVFEEVEQSYQAEAYEIFIDGEAVRVEHHELPFCWYQM